MLQRKWKSGTRDGFMAEASRGMNKKVLYKSRLDMSSDEIPVATGVYRFRWSNLHPTHSRRPRIMHKIVLTKIFRNWIFASFFSHSRIPEEEQVTEWDGWDHRTLPIPFPSILHTFWPFPSFFSPSTRLPIFPAIYHSPLHDIALTDPLTIACYLSIHASDSAYPTLSFHILYWCMIIGGVDEE